MTDDELRLKELEIEDQAWSMARRRHFEGLHRARAEGEEDDTPHGRLFMRRVIEPLAAAIRAKIEDADSGRPGRRHNAIPHLRKLPPEVCAFVTARRAISSATRPDLQHLTGLAVTLGQQLSREIVLADFAEKQPGLFYWVTGEVSDQTIERRRWSTYSAIYSRAVEDADAGWPTALCLHVGIFLVNLLCEVTGLFTVEERPLEGSRTVNMLVPTPAMREWLVTAAAAEGPIRPITMPMVCPPRPWTSSRDGGYLSPVLRSRIVAGGPLFGFKEQLRRIDADGCASVLAAVNAIQAVPWQVNRTVLDVALAMWEAGSKVAGFTAAVDDPIPPYPFPGRRWADLPEDERIVLKRWKFESSTIHSGNAKRTSQRARTAFELGVARQMALFERIYFPHQLCFRGRVYPRNQHLNPQGTDLGKGLIRFAMGKPIGTGSGPRWLAIHTANCWGYDKAPLDDRAAWTREHSDRLCRIAADPFADLWWTEADSPWCFLAAALEWAGYVRDGAAFLTRLPIALDGTCSGLQHLSAAVRDEVGGAAVNLTNAPSPRDIYRRVAEKVVVRLEKLVRKADVAPEKIAAVRLLLAYGVPREATKATTMTVPYGASAMSCSDNALRWVTETGAFPGREDDVAAILASTMWAAIKDVIGPAKAVMDWLRSLAKIVVAEERPLSWVTPDGFPVVQPYVDLRTRRVETRMGQRLVFASITEPTDKVDRKRQAASAAPNWAHSMDATHLRVSVLRARDLGVDHVAVIHDSFGTHACDTDVLVDVLRNTMADLYAADPIRDLRRQVCEIVPAIETVPEPPEYGDLDINQIRASTYLFS